MPSIRIFWTITAVSVMALALVFFPIDSFETYGIPCAIALGISVGVLSYLAMAKVKNFSELYTAICDKEAKSNNFINAAITYAIKRKEFIPKQLLKSGKKTPVAEEAALILLTP